MDLGPTPRIWTSGCARADLRSLCRTWPSTAPAGLAVEASHTAALGAGGRDNGAPKLLPHIHPNYYAAFVRDPDGHNIEFVCHQAIA